MAGPRPATIRGVQSGSEVKRRLGRMVLLAACTSLGPLSLNLCLPVGLQWGRLHATAALNYIVPFPNDNDTQAGTTPTNTLFASASLGWTIARH